MTPPWFHAVWEYMTEAQKEGVRWKADFERLDLSTVLALWPEFAPPALRHLIPAGRGPGAARDLLRELVDAIEPMLGTMNYYFGPNSRTVTSTETVNAYLRIKNAVEAGKAAFDG